MATSEERNEIERLEQECARQQARAMRAESEAAALRARIDRAIEVFALAYGSSPYHWPQDVRYALEILRSGEEATAPTEREAAERKVLEAMRSADVKLLRELLASPDRSRRDIASAEFARREAAQHAAPVAPGGDGGGI